MTDQVGNILVVATAIIIFVVLVVTTRRHKRVKAVEDEELAANIKTGFDKGILNANGQPLCIACSKVATYCTPKTGKMWVDKIPGLSLLNELTSMPPRYSIELSDDDGPRLCASHYKSALTKLKRFHAQLRSDHARFNSEQQEKVELLDQGGLEKLIKRQAAEIQENLGIGEVKALLDSSHDLDTDAQPTRVLRASSDE